MAAAVSRDNGNHCRLTAALCAGQIDGGTGCTLLALALLLGGNLDRSQALLRVATLWTFVLGIDFPISFSHTVWPRQRARQRVNAFAHRESRGP